MPSFPPYTTAQVVKSFRATVADELTVSKGSSVVAVYKEDGWLYAETKDGQRGFVPDEHCELFITPQPLKCEFSLRVAEWKQRHLEARR